MNLLKSLQNNKWLLISILGLSFILIVGQLFQTEMVFDRGLINSGQWWKILSGNFTHSNIPHLLLNLCGLCLLMLLFIDSLRNKTFIFSTLFLSVFVGLCLYYYSLDLNKYYGFSGILYGLYFIAAVDAILKNDRFTGISVALLVAGKVIWDFFTGGSQSSAELIGVPVANDAHLYGLLGSLLVIIVLVVNGRLNNTKSHPPTF